MSDAEAQAREQLAKSNDDKAKAVEQAYAHQGTPTPTQEENDLAALGVVVDPHADDGSGPPPENLMGSKSMSSRQSEAQRPGSSGSYPTRSLGGPSGGPSHQQPGKNDQHRGEQQPATTKDQSKDHASPKSS